MCPKVPKRSRCLRSVVVFDMLIDKSLEKTSPKKKIFFQALPELPLTLSTSTFSQTTQMCQKGPNGSKGSKLVQGVQIDLLSPNGESDYCTDHANVGIGFAWPVTIFPSYLIFVTSTTSSAGVKFSGWCQKIWISVFWCENHEFCVFLCQKVWN